MRQNIYSKLCAQSCALFYDNLKLLVQECQIFSKYYLNFDWFLKHLSLTYLILGRNFTGIFHMFKALVIFLPGLLHMPYSSITNLSNAP